MSLPNSRLVRGPGSIFAVFLLGLAVAAGGARGEEQEADAPKVLTKWSDLKGVPGFEDLEGIDDPSVLDDVDGLDDLESFRGLPGFEDLDEDAMLADLDVEMPAWTFETTLTGSVGYRENILLQPIDGESSGYWRTDLESMLWRFPDGKTEFVSMLGFTDVRYFSAEQTDGEQTAFLHANWNWNTTNWSVLSLPAQLLYQDQVLDLSATEAETVIGQVQVFSFSANPEWNVAPSRDLELGVSGLYRVDHFREGPDDFQDLGGRMRMTWELGPMAGLDLRYTAFVRDYATRLQYTAGGRPILGTELKADQRQVDLRLNLTLGPQSDWAVKAIGGYVDYRDNGSGYFDYDRSRLGLEVNWTPGPWGFFLTASRSHYDYLLQTVYNIEAGRIEKREKDDILAQFRMERRLSESWSWHLECEAERSETNEYFGTYNAAGAYTGVAWTF